MFSELSSTSIMPTWSPRYSSAALRASPRLEFGQLLLDLRELRAHLVDLGLGLLHVPGGGGELVDPLLELRFASSRAPS